ncbi:MAG: hypothetical protein ABI390_04795 [Daejeonella sp.]
MKNFEILYFFDCANLSVLEIKKNSLETESDPVKRFFWLVFDKAENSLKKLDFVSMIRLPELEKREFIQGSLTFDSQRAFFIFKSSLIKIELDILQPHEASEKLNKEISDYIKEADQQRI